MATLRQALREYLLADAALSAILTGGIHDAKSLPYDGADTSQILREADEVTILPFAVIRFRGATGKEIISVSERRTVEIYFYEDTAYDAIDRAMRRVKELLHRQQVKADDAGIAMFHWVQDLGEFPAPEYGHTSGDMSRYTVDSIRKPV